MKKYIKILFEQEKKIKILLIAYALYCSYQIGMSWDEGYYHEIGKINLKYLLSFGQIDEPFFMKERYSTLYWSISSLISQIFPNQIKLEVYHIINTFLGLMTIVGFYKIAKLLFNKEIAKISSMFLFFTPFFFGHLGINNKDIILAFAHIWIIYYIYKYTFFHLDLKNKLLVIFKISLLAALGTGIQLLFLGSLFPIIIIFLGLMMLKKQNFIVIFSDFLIFLVSFFTILVLFWVDTHSNIFIKPIEILIKSFSMKIGWPFNLVNGNYYFSDNLPYDYLLMNYVYKLPEYLIFLYLLSIPILFLNIEILKKKIIKNFKTLIFSIIFLLIYPSIITVIIPYSIYDGLRLFLWSTPYLVVVPAITAYVIFLNKSYFYNVIKALILILFVFHVFNFLTITPYHYTYLNLLSGKKENRYKKFENDYWSTSLKELILSSDLGDGKINFYSCGVSPELAKIYMKKKYKRSEYTTKRNASYIIMTNRSIFSKKDNKITNCYDEYTSENIHQVYRNGIILSAIKKINNE